MTKTKTHVPCVLLGCAIGDALGMPFEAYGCEVHPKLKDWDGKLLDGNYHKLQVGQWTDDTEMSIELAKSLIQWNGFDGRTTAENYVRWSEKSPTGMGGTTRKALHKLSEYEIESHWQTSGLRFSDPEAVGSGTAMRAAPIGVLYAWQPEMIRRACRADAYITHANDEAYAGSLAVASLVAGLIRNSELNPNTFDRWFAAYKFMRQQLRVVENTLTVKAIEVAIESYSSGHQPEEFADEASGRFGSVWQCVSTAIHCFSREFGDTNFMAPIEAAVRLGGDTDTRGAIVGALQGARYGLQGLPDDVRRQIFMQEDVLKLDIELGRLSLARRRI